MICDVGSPLHEGSSRVFGVSEFVMVFPTQIRRLACAVSGLWSLVCGLGAGTIESLCLTAPTDRLKVMSQAMSAKAGKPISAGALIREKGLSTLYTGAVATTLRQSSSVAVRFFCFGRIKEGMAGTLGYDSNRAPAWVSFMAGGTGGAVSVILNNPIDVAKSKIQAGMHTRYATLASSADQLSRCVTMLCGTLLTAAPLCLTDLR